MLASRFRYIRILFLFVFLLFLIAIPVSLHIIAQQKYSQEEVTVIAVEVPVRVLHKGKAVKDLTKDDFQIYENGIKQKITAFEVSSRKIAISYEIPEDDLKIPSKQRLFILIFNIFDYTENISEGIDYFFKNVFQPGDKVIILTEDRLLNIELGSSMAEMISDLKGTLKTYKSISTGAMRKAYRDISNEADRLLSLMRYPTLESKWPHVITFLDNYLRIWKEYKRIYIMPDVRLYQSMINRIKRIEGEKWALCFQQRELFPRLEKEGPLSREIRSINNRMVRSKQMELDRELDYSSVFPNEVLENLFLEANITFHLILLKPFKTLASMDFELREVAQEYEDCFKQISSATGGHSTFSNNVIEAVQEAAAVEDFHYLLVYSPKEDVSDNKRKIDVKVNKKGVKVIHLKNIRRMLAPPITISDFKSGEQAISFSINEYQQEEINGMLQGIVDIKITLFDENSYRVFNEGKTLSLTSKDTDVALNFGILKPGAYFIIIQVVDKITNDVDVYSANIML